MASSEQSKRGLVLTPHLLYRAILRGFFRTPAEEFRSVTEAATGKVIELHFDDESCCERLPFHGVLGTPATEATGSFTREAGGLDNGLKFSGQRGTVFVMNGRGIPDVIEE